MTNDSSLHSKRMKHCPGCSQRFQDLKKHMLTSSCIKDMVVCTQCDEKFISEAYFKQHINWKSNPKCKETFKAQSNRNNFTTSQVAIPWNAMQSALS